MTTISIRSTTSPISKKLLIALLLFPFLIITGCSSKGNSDSSNWCDEILRPQFSTLEEVTNSGTWFKTCKVGDGVFAIAEPYSYQEIISYLIIGNSSAMRGLNMSQTKLSIFSLNTSHSLLDRTG